MSDFSQPEEFPDDAERVLLDIAALIDAGWELVAFRIWNPLVKSSETSVHLELNGGSTVHVISLSTVEALQTAIWRAKTRDGGHREGAC